MAEDHESEALPDFEASLRLILKLMENLNKIPNQTSLVMMIGANMEKDRDYVATNFESTKNRLQASGLGNDEVWEKIRKSLFPEQEEDFDLEEVRKHAIFDQDIIGEQYDDLAEKYDGLMEVFGLADPDVVADAAVSLGVGLDIDILDIGCGTGLPGVALHSRGFRTIDGMDASAGMLEKCAQKGVYRNVIQQLLGAPENFPKKYHGQYDLVTALSCIGQGHLGVEIFDEMMLALRPGGHFIFTTRSSEWERYEHHVKIG